MFTGRQRGNSREAQASFTASVAKDLSDLDTAGGKHVDNIHIILYVNMAEIYSVRYLIMNFNTF